MRTTGIHRHTTLVAAVALAIGFLPISGALPAEAGPPATEWIAVHYDGASPGEFYGRVAAHNWATGVPLTLTVERASEVVYTEAGTAGDEYPFGQMFPDGSRFAVEPGDIATVSDGAVSRELAVMDLTLDAIGFADDIVFGATTDAGEVCVSIRDPEPDITTCELPDQGGAWSVSFSGVHDIQKDTDVAAWQYDADGDAVTVNRDLVEFPMIAVYPAEGSANSIWGNGWKHSVDVYVDDNFDIGDGTLFQYLGIPVDESGWFGAYQQLEAFQIERGQIVTVTDSVNTKVHTVMDAWIDSFDVDADTISGRADPGSSVEVITGPPGDERSIYRNVTADGTGGWVADFSVAVGAGSMDAAFDVVPGTDATANLTDDDDDMTGIDAAAPNPRFSVDPSTNRVQGEDWSGSSSVTITVDDPDTIGAPDYTSGPVDVESWGPDPSEVGFSTEIGFDVAEGHTVTVAGESATKSHVVTGLVLDGIDEGADVVSGHAAPSSEVLVMLWGTDTLPHVERVVSADATGYWEADFSEAVGPDQSQGTRDVTVDTGGAVRQSDVDDDSTELGIGSGEESLQGSLFVVVSDQGDAGVGGAGWNADDSITVEVLDGGSVMATVTTVTPPDPDEDYWWGVGTGIAIHPGWTVTATGDQSGYTVSTEVTDVVVEGWDDQCTVYGTTTYDPSNLVVDVYEPQELTRFVTWTTDSSVPAVHSWTADFCQDPLEGERGDAVNNDLIAPRGQAMHQVSGLGSTMYHFPPEGGGGEQGFWFSVETPYQVWGDGESWPVGAVVALNVDDPSNGPGVDFSDTTQVESMGSEPWEVGFRFELDGIFEIQPGHVVTITSDFDGDSVLDVDKTLEVVDMGEINVDPSSGIVSGDAPPGAWVNVNGGNESEGAWREVEADGDGFFTANLAVAVSPGEDGDGTITVPFSDGGNQHPCRGRQYRRVRLA